MKVLILIIAMAMAIAGCKKTDVTDPNNNTTITGNDGKYLAKVNYRTPSINKEATIYEIILDASGNLTALKIKAVHKKLWEALLFLACCNC